MKNILSCGTGRAHHNQETTGLSRGSEINNLMNYFWNYMDPNSNYAETAVGGFESEPRMQVVETKDAVNITAELPGIKQEDLDLKISSDGYLTLCGEKKNVNETTEKNAYFSEITYGTFKRTIPLPWDLDYDKASASFKDGVLKVFVPKSQDEKQKFKKIAINETAHEAEAHTASHH